MILNFGPAKASKKSMSIRLLPALFLSFFLINQVVIAQHDPKAKKILDDVSAQTKTYTSISAEFSMKSENKKTQSKDVQDGKIVIRGSKYKLDISNQTILSDGKISYTVLRDANEVQINHVEEKVKEGAITPDNIFTVYEKGFKYEFAKEEVEKSGRVLQHIKLFPVDIKKKNFHTAVISIDKKKKQVVSLKILGKDGTDVVYLVKKFEINTIKDDSLFNFDKKAYPGYELVDLR